MSAKSVLAAPFLAAVAVAALAAGTAGPALAAGGPPPSGSVDLTVSLASSDPGSLRAAVHTPLVGAAATPAGLLRAHARLASARPSATERANVGQWLASAGLTVTGDDGWTLQVHGPAAGARQLFGRTSAGAALPVPAGLRDTVLAVAAGGGAAPWQHRIDEPPSTFPGYGPADVRSAYAVPAAGDGTGTTVGVVAFSGWKPSDAATYAQTSKIALAPGQIDTRPIAPLSAKAAGTPDGAGGDFEVALDVEAVLAGAPAAAQKVYVGENSAAGAIALWSDMAKDAEAGRLTAVTTSWGACEQDIDEPVLRSIEQSIARIVAAGATVLAASGDAGAFDCGDGSTVSVDFPASSDLVLAVGGTRLTGQPADWQETGWSVTPGTTAIEASGGGFSTRTARPSWQSGVPLDSGGKRMVPDISGLADPSRGLLIYGDGGDGSGSGWYLAGGTSLASPVQAGLLAATLSSVGRSNGPGLLQPLFYGASGAFRDVTSGDNGKYQAAPGYDLVTGLGSPMWSKLAEAFAVRPTQPFPGVTRFAGNDRFVTAATVFTSSFGCAATNGTGTPDALVATGLGFADALAGNALAGSLSTGTLLTAADSLPVSSLAALRRSGVRSVHLLGGTSAISDAVARQLSQSMAFDCQGNPTGQPFQVDRIGGVNRFDTARLVAARSAAGGVGTLDLTGSQPQPTAVLATGLGFADALASGPLSYRGTAGGNGNGKPFPTLLTLSGALSPEARQALTDLGVSQVIVPGGSAAVSEAVAGQVRALGINIIRLAGNDRTATAAALAAFATTKGSGLGFDAGSVSLARGDGFADALTGGPNAGRGAHPVLLTVDPATLGGPTTTALRGFAGTAKGLAAYGGTSALADPVLQAARSALGL